MGSDLGISKLRQLALSLAFVISASSSYAAAPQVVEIPAGAPEGTVQEFNSALGLFNSGKYAEAAALYLKVSKAVPQFAEAHQMYGTALLKVGKTTEAIAELKKATELKPGLSEISLALGNAYQMQGTYPEAIEQFKHYLQLNPKGAQYEPVKAMISALQTEMQRSKGVQSSKGKDNYLAEALALAGARWSQSQMPLTISISSGAGLKGYRDEFTDILKQAFNDWAAATDGKIRLDFSAPADKAWIVCTWIDNPKEVINPDEGGQALVAPDSNGDIAKSLLKLLTQNPHSAEPISAAGMRQICLHETGHALGIFGHSSQAGDVMFTTVDYNVPVDHLSERDKKTMLELYSVPASVLASHKVKTENVAMLGADNNPQNRALKLNVEANNELLAGHYAQAIAKCEEALKLAPDNNYINANLGAIYAKMGTGEYKQGKVADAEKHMLSAAEYFQKGGQIDVAISVYKNLVTIARSQGHQVDAEKYEEKSRSLKPK